MPTLINVIVRDKMTGMGVPGAGVIWWDQGGRSDSRTTDGGGFCNFGSLVSGGITVGVLAPKGYNNQSTYKVDDDPVFFIDLEPSVVPFNVAESGYIRASGIQFIDDNSRPWLLSGLSIHTLISNVSKNENVSWIFDLMDQVGANTILTIGCHLSQWKIDNGFFYDPRRSDHPSILANLFDQAAARNKRVLFQALADAQSLTLHEKQKIWEQAIQVARGRWNVLLGKGNEHPVNGWDPSELRNPSPSELAGVLASQGSHGGDVPPVEPYLDFVQWETRIEPHKKMIDDAGAGVWEMIEGYDGFNPCLRPIIVSETGIFNDTNPDGFGDFRWTDPKVALRLGVNTGANFAGGCFGTTQSLIARQNGPIANMCVREWFRGMWRGFVR